MEEEEKKIEDRSWNPESIRDKEGWKVELFEGLAAVCYLIVSLENGTI